MKINHLFEEDEKHVTFCFGRLNPPTIGHKQLLDTMKKVGGDMKIFVSQSQDSKKNPLSYEQKIDFMRKLFPEYSENIVNNPSLNTLPKIASHLNSLGYKHATFVAGSDRLKDMESLLKAYNGKKEGKKGPLEVTYEFDTLDFKSSGEREDGAEGVGGVSASKARAAAEAGDIETFGMATGAGEHTEALYKAVRNGMGITDKEELEERLQNKLKELNEGGLVVSAGGVRGTVIDLIAGKIMTMDDYEKLSKWLKMIVGKEIKPHGKNRYIITSEDVREAIGVFKERIGKVKGGFRLYSKKGKNLGTFDTRAGAEKHEREVQAFKHMGK